MRYIYSRIWIHLKTIFRIVFGENKVRGAIAFVLLAALLTTSTVLGLRSFEEKSEEIIVEDPIESYDKITVIEIGGDDETESETTDETIAATESVTVGE
ncbi:MAG: hypothetical protein IJ457_06670 [Clostridia bacterium]|nr:hypothetical protein [Clostridia bacterium]